MKTQTKGADSKKESAAQVKLPKGQGLSSGQTSKRAQILMGSHGTPSVITVVGAYLDKNPKRGESAKRFALYRNGMTIQQYIDGVVGLGETKRKAWLDLAWDTHHAFITLEAKPNPKAETSKPEVKAA